MGVFIDPYALPDTAGGFVQLMFLTAVYGYILFTYVPVALEWMSVPHPAPFIVFATYSSICAICLRQHCSCGDGPLWCLPALLFYEAMNSKLFVN